MKKLIQTSALFSFLLPYIVSFAPLPPDSSLTTIEFAAGHGSYADVTRDCNGNVVSVKDIPYSDFSASISHEFSVVKLGMTGGTTTGERGSMGHSYTAEEASTPMLYVVPSIGLNTKYFGLDAGMLFVINEKQSLYASSSRLPGFPSGTLRIGRLDNFYFSTSVARNLPLFAGGGLFDLGLGFSLGRSHAKGWIGVGGYPYDGLVFSTKWEIPVSNTFLLTPRLNVGGRASFEYGLAIGGKFSF